MKQLLCLSIPALLSGHTQVPAQLYISPPATLRIKSGMPLAIDSPALMPFQDMALNNFTSMLTYVPVGGITGGSSINRIYSFSTPPSFRGMAAMLQLAYNSTGGNRITTTRTAANKGAGCLAYVFNSPVMLSSVTAANNGMPLKKREYLN